MVHYVTYDQFAYTASVSAQMTRERPAAIFLVGYFFAESLILAETGQSTGAIQPARQVGRPLRGRRMRLTGRTQTFARSMRWIQSGAIIAGQADPTQLPFFVATCDYTLIGEEMYAASAYLSREPVLLGSMRGQDIAKALILVVGIAGIIAVSFGATWFVDLVRPQ